MSSNRVPRGFGTNVCLRARKTLVGHVNEHNSDLREEGRPRRAPWPQLHLLPGISLLGQPDLALA